MVLALVVLGTVAGPAVTAPTEVLPDLRQKVPWDIELDQIKGAWLIGFASAVWDEGPGYLKISGNGPGNGPMVADQYVQMSDGTETKVPRVGELIYAVSPTHQHWHFKDFMRYELRRASNPDKAILRDHKTGFCLGNAFTRDNCGRNHPELTKITVGFNPNGYDEYPGFVEGQTLPLTEKTTPDGDYLLVNRVNAAGTLHEANPANNAASVRMRVRWSSGKPSIRLMQTCEASIACPAAPAPSVATMDGPTARGFARQAIRSSAKRDPRNLAMACKRRSSAAFACSARWQSGSRSTWRGRVKVSYGVTTAGLSWYYDLSAVRRPDWKRIVQVDVPGRRTGSAAPTRVVSRAARR
ncbi:MAG TPA: lysyl oxidase family protein, partial [Thermoleophilaceae bacterium]|nr:lysyl oxidase family protein [Thermoleophilaceae bacterium]